MNDAPPVRVILHEDATCVVCLLPMKEGMVVMTDGERFWHVERCS